MEKLLCYESFQNIYKSHQVQVYLDCTSWVAGMEWLCSVLVGLDTDGTERPAAVRYCSKILVPESLEEPILTWLCTDRSHL